MKKQVFYIHGGDAYGTYDSFIEDLKNRQVRIPQGVVQKTWYQSLRKDLGSEYEVFTPQMPNKQNAKYEEWKIWFERHFEFLQGEVVLLGWSLGGIFLAKYLSENDTPFTIEKLILMAAPFNSEDLHDVGCGDFILDPERVSQLPKKVGEMILMHSKDDFVVPYDHALIYQTLLLTAELITYNDKNHFLVESLPELIEIIKER